MELGTDGYGKKLKKPEAQSQADEQQGTGEPAFLNTPETLLRSHHKSPDFTAKREWAVSMTDLNHLQAVA